MHPRTANGQRRVASTFVAVGCLLVLSIGVAYVVGQRALKLNGDLARESEAIRELEAFVSALKDAETGQRGYLLTGEEQYLDPFRAGEAEIKSKSEELRRLVSSGHLAGNNVERREELVGKKLAELEET